MWMHVSAPPVWKEARGQWKIVGVSLVAVYERTTKCQQTLVDYVLCCNVEV